MDNQSAYWTVHRQRILLSRKDYTIYLFTKRYTYN